LKQGYYAKLKTLIEKTYNNGGNKRVVLIVHSMGAPVSLYFLNRYVNQEWKDTYLKAYVSISGAWRGAVNAVKAFVSGQNEGIVIDLPIWARPAQRTYPSTAFLLPMPSDTWPRDHVLITTPTRNYTAWDYHDLFDDIGYPRANGLVKEVGNLTSGLTPPNVTTFNYYGHQYPTPSHYIYTDGEFPDVEPIVILGDGDGTVNLNSLLSVERWKKQMPYSVTMVGFADVEHVDAVKNDDIIKHVDDVVCNLKE
jgi:lysophospholipase-3